MKTVKTTLSATLQDYLDVAPGQTPSEKLHWVVNFWASTVDGHRDRLKAEKALADRPAQLELVAERMDDAADDRGAGNEVATARVIVDLAGN